jgi:branched-chain amino acid aminotransferase
MRYVYFEGNIVPETEARLSVKTHAFLYGTACFEGIRGYWVPEKKQILIFRMKDHYHRLLQSCKILTFKPKLSLDQLCEITAEVIKRNNDQEDVYIRPVFYKSAQVIGVNLKGPDEFLCFAQPMGEYLDINQGLKVKVSSWRHVDDNVIPMRAKINGAYINAALAKEEALADGYDEAIFLDTDGHVSEGSAENLFIVRNGKLITPPVTANILEGVTRHSIITLAKEEMGLTVEERQIDRTELYIADEAFFVGTGAQVSFIGQVDHRQIGNGEGGSISRQLQKLYFDVVRGRVNKYLDWCYPVQLG